MDAILTDHTVHELCRQAQAGDLNAANELLRWHYRPIYAYLRRLCGNDSDAADLPTFQARSRFSTWLYSITRHVYLDWRRAQTRAHLPLEPWWDDVSPASTFADVAGPDLARKVFESVESLKLEIREVVYLHYYQDLSLKDTAEVLGIATSTVKYRLREALAKLKSQLDKLECSSRQL
jgi:RNA polymerase sigma-70 factor (ECF subfamily)